MGVTIRPGTAIRDFQPDDTESAFFLSTEYQSVPLSTILELAKQKWGADLNLDNLKISAEHLHTECLGFDRYDSGDYTNFLEISYSSS